MSEVRREPGASVFFADLDVGEVEHEDLIGVSADLQSNEDGTSVALARPDPVTNRRVSPAIHF